MYQQLSNVTDYKNLQH